MSTIPTTAAIRQLDPYYSTPDEQRARLNCDVSQSDANLVRQIYLIRGPFQAVLGTLYSRFCEQLRIHGITGPEHSSDFLAALAGCTITLPNTQHNDGRGTHNLGEESPDTANQRPVAPSGDSSREQRTAKNGNRRKKESVRQSEGQ